jgi:hypothetical protein
MPDLLKLLERKQPHNREEPRAPEPVKRSPHRR